MTEKLGFLKALNSIIVVMPTVEGKALLEQHNLINLFSKEWEERCRAAT